MERKEILIAGGEGSAFIVKKGEYVKIIDVDGKQVADLVAINLEDKREFVSTSHTRTMNNQITLKKGHTLYSNYRRGLLELEEDTVGVHDLLFPCCDPKRYSLDFNIENHGNCRENFEEALAPYGIEYWRIPDPVNLFQNSPVNSDGSFDPLGESKSEAGDFVIFKALEDVVVGISACPQDMTPLCGWKITDIKAEVYKDGVFTN